jgi:hypothetical protein
VKCPKYPAHLSKNVFFTKKKKVNPLKNIIIKMKDFYVFKKDLINSLIILFFENTHVNSISRSCWGKLI